MGKDRVSAHCPSCLKSLCWHFSFGVRGCQECSTNKQMSPVGDGPFPRTCMPSTCVPKWQLLVRAPGTDPGGLQGRSSPRDAWSPRTAVKYHDLDACGAIVRKLLVARLPQAVEETDLGGGEGVSGRLRFSDTCQLKLLFGAIHSRSIVTCPPSPFPPWPCPAGVSKRNRCFSFSDDAVGFSTWGNAPACFS